MYPLKSSRKILIFQSYHATRKTISCGSGARQLWPQMEQRLPSKWLWSVGHGCSCDPWDFLHDLFSTQRASSRRQLRTGLLCEWGSWIQKALMAWWGMLSLIHHSHVAFDCRDMNIRTYVYKAVACKCKSLNAQIHVQLQILVSNSCSGMYQKRPRSCMQLCLLGAVASRRSPESLKGLDHWWTTDGTTD